MKSKVLKSNNSPHLALVLEQLANTGELDELEATKILVSFETAITKNGLSEVGYIREEGQSFNPRPARILLILLKDAGVRDLNTLTIAVERAGSGENYSEYLNVDNPVVVSAAFLLDRLRHLHLEKNADKEQVYLACIKTKELISKEFTHLALLLEKGVQRVNRHSS